MNRQFYFFFLYLMFVSFKLDAQSGSGTAVFTTGILTENFDAFTAVGCPCNGGMSTGWYVSDGIDSKWNTGTGTSAAGDLYLLGSGTDKALGGVRTALAAPAYGVNINNTTGNVITSLRVQYTGESWRVVNRNTADRLDFQYNVGGGGIGDVLTATGWVDVDALDYRTLPLAAAGTATTGASNSVLTMDYTITGLSIPSGGNIFLRWVDLNVTSSNDATAIDDISITANPTCGTGITYVSQNFEAAFPVGSCWSATRMDVSGSNAVYGASSGRSTTTGAVTGTTSEQIKADQLQTGLYEMLNNALPSTLSWEFTVRSEAGTAISTSNLWGFFLYTNQNNLISTTANTGYAVGVNLGGSSDKTIKLYKMNAQRWDAAAITTLVTSAYVYPASAATQIDRSITVKVVRTGSSASANWQLYINNVLQGAATDASPVLLAATTSPATPSFTTGFFNIHAASKLFLIDDVLTYSGTRPCNTQSSMCRVASLLPLNLVSFRGTSTGKITTLDWEVSHQTNTKTFELERSPDGSTFEVTARIPVSVSENRYRYSIAQNDDQIYYRLKMVDFDQFVSYSGIVKVMGNAKTVNSFFINPNPVNGSSNLLFSKPETGTMQVFNSSGNLVLTQKFSNQLQLSLKTDLLPTGAYQVVFISSSGFRQVARFVKL